jgi:pimeloyl-ACP methyl ester carboxylesterase
MRSKMDKPEQGIIMPEKLRHFWSQELEDEFNAAYDNAMHQWPVQYDDVYVSTTFGNTHAVASGLLGADFVVLLNPGGGSATIWNHNIESLSQQYRVFAIDVIGEMNKSEPTRPIRNHPEFQQWMTELLDGLEIQTAHFIGNSNGGFFTLETAYLLPKRTKKVVLISPAATFIQMWAWWLKLLIPAHMVAPLIHSENIVHNAYDWLWQGFPRDPADERLKYIAVVAGYPRYRPSINSFAPHLFSDEELRQIQAPVLLLIGDHEVIYNPDQVIQRATRQVPNLRAKIVPNANHCAQYTAPEFVNHEILEFLKED